MSYPDPMMASSREEYELFLFLQQSGHAMKTLSPQGPADHDPESSASAMLVEEHRASRRKALEMIVEKRKGYYEPLKRRAEAGEPLTETEQRILQNCEDVIRQLREL